tara:strand:- start:1318 stop:1602 length:285 start_codon:yes stop_codon:yes gene_type:complete
MGNRCQASLCKNKKKKTSKEWLTLSCGVIPFCMSNIESEVNESLAQRLKSMINQNNFKIEQNKRAFEKLTREQTTLKRERAKLSKMVKELEALS